MAFEAEPRTGSTARLAEQTYRELRQIAGRYLRVQPPDHTLQPTALVHEAFLRLARAREAGWENRTQFLAFAARAMRSVLIDGARRRKAVKRDGGVRMTLVDGAAIVEARPLDVLALDEALERLAAHEPRAARVVELRYFGGLEIDEVADVLEISSATAKRDWRFARAWLARELGDQSGATP
jgi:RNA polymerase sigma factor (TIGR02999 family)